MSYEKEQIMMQERRERIAAKCLQGLLASGKYHNAPMLAAVDDAVSYTSVMMAVLDGKPVSSEYPDAYLHVNRERPDMRGVSLSHDESGYNTHYDTFPLYRHPAPGWQPIETAPKGQRILVVTEKRVPFFAKYILPRTHEANSDSALDWAEWDEMSDTPWCPEGWYMEVDCELCEVDYRWYAGLPLAQWMPAPEVPA